MERASPTAGSKASSSASSCRTSGPGREFLLGLRQTRDFGPVVTLAAGGDTQVPLARSRPTGRPRSSAPSSTARTCSTGDRPARRRAALAIEPQRITTRSSTARTHGRRAPACSRSRARRRPTRSGFGINPLVVSDGRLVALDARETRATARGPAGAAPDRAHPHAARAAHDRGDGRLERMNPEGIILRNVLRRLRSRGRHDHVEAGHEQHRRLRVRAVARRRARASGPARAQHSAPQVAEAITQAADEHLAESVVLIPGGLLRRRPATRPSSRP